MAEDFSEVMKLAADLGKASKKVYDEADRIAEKTALLIKNSMQREARSNGRTQHFAGSISYDRAAKLGAIGYEIGPDKDRTQGALGNLLYFGSSNNGPTLDVEVGIRLHEPDFIKRMEKLGEELIDGD